MDDTRTLVSDDDILRLLKRRKIDSWEELLERTGYTNISYVKKRLKNMENLGMIEILRNKPLTIKVIRTRELISNDPEYKTKSIAWNKRKKEILAEARKTLEKIGR